MRWQAEPKSAIDTMAYRTRLREAHEARPIFRETRRFSLYGSPIHGQFDESYDVLYAHRGTDDL